MSPSKNRPQESAGQEANNAPPHDASPRMTSRFKIYGALALGLATALAIRALIVLDHVQPGWARPFWYFAVLGNFLFFSYRYQITQKRKRAEQQHLLIHKVSSNEPLTRGTGRSSSTS